MAQRRIVPSLGTHPIAQRYQSTSLLLSGLKRLEKLCQTPYEEGPKYDYPNKPRNHVPSESSQSPFYGSMFHEFASPVVHHPFVDFLRIPIPIDAPNCEEDCNNSNWNELVQHFRCCGVHLPPCGRYPSHVLNIWPPWLRQRSPDCSEFMNHHAINDPAITNVTTPMPCGFSTPKRVQRVTQGAEPGYTRKR